MFTRTYTIIICTILFLICISKSNTIIDDDFNPTVSFYLNSSNHDCFFIVGPKSGPTERIGSVKVLLSAHSEPFRKLLEDNEVSGLGDIELVDIEPKTFKDFLLCLYGGCDLIKKISIEECGKVLYIIEKYSVTEVKNKLISRLLKLTPLGLDDLLTALSLPVYFNNKEKHKAIAEKVFEYTKDIFDDKRFLSLDDNALMIIVKQDPISVPEIIVWEAILKWGKHNSKSNNGKIVREKISPLLEFIRFCSMDLKEFYQSVIPANVLTYEEVIKLLTSLVIKQCHNITGLSHESGSRYVPKKVEQEQDIYLHYYVKNVTELGENKWYYSEPFEVGDFSWKIEIRMNIASFDFYMYCTQSPNVKPNPSWEIRAAVDYILVNLNGGLNRQRDLSVATYTKDSRAWGHPSFINWNDLINPSNGYIKDNNILLLAHVKLNPKE